MQICSNIVTDVSVSPSRRLRIVVARTCKPASSYQFRRIAHNGEIKRAKWNGGGIELADLSSLRSSTYLKLSSAACARALLRVAQVYGRACRVVAAFLTRTFTVVSAVCMCICVCVYRRRRAISRRENCLLAQRRSIVREMFLRGHGSWVVSKSFMRHCLALNRKTRWSEKLR